MNILTRSAAVVILTAAALPALAQNATSGSESNSSSGSNVAVQTQSSVQNNSYGADHITTNGTLRNVPGVVAPSMSSGHPCAWSPLSGGIGIVGAGASLGGQSVDDACLLAQMGYTDEAMHMIASRNPNACVALRAAGKINEASDCGERRRVRPVAAQVAEPRPEAPAVLYRSCRMRDDGKVGVTYVPGADKAVANRQCLTALGY